MAQFKQWFTQDLTESIVVRHCESVMFTGDDNGAVVGVRLFDGGPAYSSGGTVSGAVKRSDGGLVPLTGTLSGNAASVVIPAAALAYPGPIGVHIILTQGGSVTTVLKAIYSVDDNTGAAVDPGTIIPSVNDLITAINNAVASVPSDYSALLAVLAKTFSDSASYSAGDYVWYNGHLYKFTANHAVKSWSWADVSVAVIGDDISSVKSAIGINAFDIAGFENGAISETNGRNSNSAERIRSMNHISHTVKYLRSTVENIRFMLYAYTQSTNVYVGALQSDGTFGTSAGSHVTIDLNAIYTQHPMWNFRVVIRLSGGAVQIDTVSGIYFDTYVQDFPQLEKVSALESATSENTANITKLTGVAEEYRALNLSGAVNINSAELWEDGGIQSTTGQSVASSGRARTKHYVPTNAGIFNMRSGSATRGFYIYAYDLSGNFIGGYKNDGTFVKDGSSTGFNTVDAGFNIGALQAQYPNYRFRFALYVRGGGSDITASEYGEWTLISQSSENTSITVVQYNIGKFNYGVAGGLAQNVAEKLQNYKEFFGGINPDYLCLQELTDYIDSGNTYASDASLFDPMFLKKSHYEHETAIKAQRPLLNTYFSYLHTTGDYPAWCVYGTTIINGKVVAIISGVLNPEAPAGIDHSEQQIRALTKLTSQTLQGGLDFNLSYYDYAIIGMDTNCLSQAEAQTVLSFMRSKGYRSANWDYFGYKDTYKLSSSMYKAIDNIFVKGDMRIVNFTVPDVYSKLSSDHFPVVAEIRI